MAVTQADLERLDAAIAKSAVLQSFTVGSSTWTFRSAADMKALRAELARQLAASGGTARPYRLAATRKGV
ncbi:MAG: hypothetical protein JW767_04670 [Thermoleophilia bacterium]|nr:hypothetical protein [Thermoleophilia bacterium]